MLAPALTILFSSFLLFLVQPILAKQILPWFGGSAAVWTICLVFFQMVLLLGYTYAHALARWRAASRPFVLHVCLLLASLLILPIIPAMSWRPGHDPQPTLRILGLLTATVGLPYLLLASTSPLLQRWLSGAGIGGEERSIYRLFALSNLGSLAGLLSYPFAVEPFSTVHVQAWVWSCAYGVFVGCFVTYAWKRRQLPDRHATPAATGTVPGIPASPRRYAYWIACGALGSALLLSVTNQVTQNVASIPFLWIVPLSIYLLSFIVCFEGRSGEGWYQRRLWMTPAMVATGAMAWALFADQGHLSDFVALPICMAGLFFGCVVCHGELARSKPHPDQLTHFYLSLAGGGAMGGLLVGLVAPKVFDGYWEMPLTLLGLAALGIYGCSQEIRVRPRTPWKANVIAAAVATALILFLLDGLPAALNPYTQEWTLIVKGEARWGCAALLVMAAFLLQRYRMLRAIALTALLCTLVFDWRYYHALTTGTRFAVRNFYGTLRVIDADGPRRIRLLKHGVIVHGSQRLEPSQSRTPTTYYGESSGIGRTLMSAHRAIGPVRIGSVGLGAGTLAAYGRPGDLFRVYELNPEVLHIAQTQFSYLKDSQARVEPVLGDARLSLELELAEGAFDEADRRFDVLSLDAFSGDAIPVHLLTREAFDIYARAVKADGVIAFHVSNEYLDLAPVVERSAREAGFEAVLVADRPSLGLTSASDWVLVTRSAAFLERPDIAPYITPITSRAGLSGWTDQFSNLFQILR